MSHVRYRAGEADSPWDGEFRGEGHNCMSRHRLDPCSFVVSPFASQDGGICTVCQ